MFRLGLGAEPDPPQLDDHVAAAVERVMGVDQGRRYRPNGVEAWLTEPPSEGIALFQQIGSLPRLIETMESAEDRELKNAAPFARTLLTGLTAFSQIADAFAGYRNASGMAAVAALKDEPIIRIMLIAFIISAMRNPKLSENFRDVHETLTSKILPIDASARELAALPKSERAERLQRLPWRISGGSAA